MEFIKKSLNGAFRGRDLRLSGSGIGGLGIIAAAGLLALTANVSHAQGYFQGNTATGVNSGQLSVGTSLSGWQFAAQPFTTAADANGKQLQDVSITMKDFLFGTDGLFMSLFDNIGGLPGNQLVSLNGSWIEGHQSFTPETAFQLEGDKDYFLVIGSDPVQEGFFSVVTVTDNGSRTTSINGEISIINNSLGNWKQLSSGDSFRMSLTAVSVPEPAAASLIIVGLTLAGLRKRFTHN